jgi:hypothetical protein
VRGLNVELTWAAHRPEVAQADRLLVLPGDVPGVRVSELFRLVLPPFTAALDDRATVRTRNRKQSSHAPEHSPGVRLVQSPDGGTNALVLSPPHAIPFRFGPGSAARHRAEAVHRGMRAESVPLPSLASDIDQPEDLLVGGRVAGPRTRRILSALSDGGLRYRRRSLARRQSSRHRHEEG